MIVLYLPTYKVIDVNDIKYKNEDFFSINLSRL